MLKTLKFLIVVLVVSIVHENLAAKQHHRKKRPIFPTDELVLPTTETFDDLDDALGMGRTEKIKLWYGDVFAALQVVRKDGALPSHPKQNGAPSKIISIPQQDPLVKVSGVYGNYFGAQHLAKVVFTLRSGKTFGPFGSGAFMPSTKPFSLGLGRDKKIFAFYGGSYLHTDKTIYLSKLGVYTRTDDE
jgi:hypothetical protein